MKHLKKISVCIMFFIVFSLCKNIYAEELPSKFDLRDYISIEVRNQKDTNTCWAFSITSLLSTHLLYLYDEACSFSPRHMEYTMSEDAIIGKENRYAYKYKKLGIGGNENVVKQYLAQGKGPVLEEAMPFENSSEPITEEELEVGPAYKQVTEASHILPMYKEWVNGELVYKDYTKKTLSKEDVKIYQDNVKSAIKTYGGVEATISFDEKGFNRKNGSFNTKTQTSYWHSILLIGWDDSYSKENFNEKNKPLTDGAYIAVNSWGRAAGDNGFMYISYEDLSIDSNMKMYIKKIEDANYDNVYYNDLSVAKNNNEVLTELTLTMDSSITGSAYFNLIVDGEYVLKNALFDDCIDNFVLTNPVILNNETVVSLEMNVEDKYKQYIHPYYYTVTNTPNVGKKGDLSLDGRISVLDLSKLKVYLVGLIELSAESQKAADINNDGRVTITDLSLLKRLLISG